MNSKWLDEVLDKKSDENDGSSVESRRTTIVVWFK